MTETSPGASTHPPAGATDGRRRRWLLGVVAGAAAVAGAGLAVRHQLADSGSNAEGGSGPVDGATGALWQTSFETPAGKTLSMASLRGKPLMVNFWATWCPPCVDELPLINGFYKDNLANGWQVLGIAVDQLAAVNSFLGKMPLLFPVALAGMSGVELSKSLGNLSGGLPFTVVFGAGGSILHRKMGRVTPEDLRIWATLK